jgi:hypothetical protein
MYIPIRIGCMGVYRSWALSFLAGEYVLFKLQAVQVFAKRKNIAVIM